MSNKTTYTSHRREVLPLKELINMYDAGEFNDFPAGSVFRTYPTEEHQKQQSVWWMPIEELKAFAISYKIANDQLSKLFWGR